MRNPNFDPTAARGRALFCGVVSFLVVLMAVVAGIGYLEQREAYAASPAALESESRVGAQRVIVFTAEGSASGGAVCAAVEKEVNAWLGANPEAWIIHREASLALSNNRLVYAITVFYRR